MPTADPDNDGASNLYEYAFDGNPTNCNVSGISPSFRRVTEAGTNWLEYVYARRTDAGSGLLYQLEFCPYLNSWTNGDYTETGTSVIDAHFVAVTNRVALLTETNQYIRLRVSFQ